MKKILAIVVLTGLLILLLSSFLEMPVLGSIENPSYNDTTHYYLDNAVEDTNAPNVIAAIITDYRAFDTVGETVVLFTAIAAAASVLRVLHDDSNKEKVKH
ncbi:multicomponent Na+:H+ antiporter subunit B [Natronincola peptidivorans]|uniref:Multicomponent Na+:H+ antiporter subunit B n=1 Tax=Natronincola peptidivorans TaxID=426128 RepID=A0A1I0BKI6_9FIRM|nr:hydrogen gas-evolving membrane-bound hydrogenase subunit E [Natronincola peptidivorans]SET06767.1 multicomponent Na+:H+ antiporter subunit B [Natronincola peptidivorans]